MSHYILDVAYRITDPEGVEANRVMVQGTNAGECTAPPIPNAGAILGVTVYDQPLQNQSVALRKAGIARVVAVGPVQVGDAVNISGNSGRVKAIDEPASTKINCLGFAETAAIADGDIIEVFISLHQRIA